MTTSSKQQAASSSSSSSSKQQRQHSSSGGGGGGKRKKRSGRKRKSAIGPFAGRAFVVAGAHHEKLRQECLKHEPTFGSLPVPWLFCSARDALHCAAAAAAEAIESASKRKLREILSVIL